MVQALAVKPVTRKGTAMGMYATVTTEASIMKAAVAPMSPRALSTIGGRKGAQGAIPSRTKPMAYAGSSGMIFVSA